MLFKKYMPMLALAGLIFSNIYADEEYLIKFLGSGAQCLIDTYSLCDVLCNNKSSNRCDDTIPYSSKDLTYRDFCDTLADVARANLDSDNFS